MKYQVVTCNHIEGVHCWKKAPSKFGYLRNKHRHVFVIRCWFDVTETDREIEINDKQGLIQESIYMSFGNSRGTGADFRGMSCEEIARWCIKAFECAACEVLEDGFGGAYVRQ